MEDTNQQVYLKAMQKMKEDDFTKYLIKPLFESMVFFRVDFYGGPYESGKDLIAFVEVPVNKTMSYAIQSKKIGEETNTSEKAILGELVFQLRQCFTNPIKLHNGDEVIPDQVYLASPYQISLRLINEIHGMLKIDGKKIEILDGPSVIKLLKTHKPTLLDKLLSVDDIFSTQDNTQLCNVELMSALNQQNSIHELDCYSDLAFFMGTIDSNVLLNSRFTIKPDKFQVTQGEWEWFERKVYNPLKSLTAIEPLIQDANSVLRKYNNELNIYTSKENRKIKNGIDQANLNALDILINKLEDSEKVLSKEILMDSMGVIDGLSTSPFRLFDCQHDIAVYGSAGAGKTTTLQMYARKLEQEGNRGVIYLPLNRFLNKVEMNIESKSKNYDILMSMILISKSLEPIRENIEKLELHLQSKKRNKVIFDGLDEAYVKFPGIIEAINSFKNKFNGLKIKIQL